LIAQDYELTRIGLEGYPHFLSTRSKGWHAPGPDNIPGCFEISSCEARVMLAFVAWLEETYGGDGISGAEGWLAKELGFTGADIENVKKNLVKV
jgi:hypothetical protein